jgi:hypothetical protein
MKIGYVDDRLILDHQTNAATIEECQLSCSREQVPQAQHVAVKPLRLCEILDGSCDLADWAKREFRI